jgi:uncharacterized membrane protein
MPPMSDDPTRVQDTILGISFADVFRAEEFSTATLRLVSQGKIELRDSVRIVKLADGKTHVRESIDPQPATSALSGGMWAGLFGLLLGGPVGWIAGTAIGAGAGAVRAKVVDLGIPDEWVAWFREAVQPGTSTVVLLVGTYDRAAVTAELGRFAGGHLVYANLPPDGINGIRTALGDADLPAPPDDLPPPSDEVPEAPTDLPAPSDEAPHQPA